MVPVINEMVELREYQKEGIKKIFEAWDPKSVIQLTLVQR